MVRRLPQAETFGVIVTEENAKAGAKQHLVFLKLADVAQLSHRTKSENNDMVFSFSQIFSSGWANNENLMNKGVRLTSVSVVQPARVHWKFACLTCNSNSNMAWTSVVEGSHRIMHTLYPIRMWRGCLNPPPPEALDTRSLKPWLLSHPNKEAAVPCVQYAVRQGSFPGPTVPFTSRIYLHWELCRNVTIIGFFGYESDHNIYPGLQYHKWKPWVILVERFLVTWLLTDGSE